MDKYTDMTISDLTNLTDDEIDEVHKERARQWRRAEDHRDEAASALQVAEAVFIGSQTDAREAHERFAEVDAVISSRQPEVTA